MSQESPDQRWGFGRLVIAALAATCVVLAAINIWVWINKNDRPHAAAGVPAGPLERPAHGSPSSVAAPSPETPGVHDSPPPAERRPVPAGAGGVLPGIAAGGQGRVSGTVAPGAGRVPAAAGVGAAGAPGAPGAPGIDDFANAPAFVANGTARRANAPARAANVPGAAATAGGTAEGSATLPTGAPGPPIGGVAMPSSYAQAPAVPGAPRGAPSEAPGAGKPDDKTPPEEDKPKEDDSGTDSTPPALELLRFDPAQVEGGSTTTLTVQASDAQSGVKSIWGEVRSPNRSAIISFGSPSVGSGGAFSFPVALPRQAETGVWYVSWISLTDGAANTKLIQASSAATAPPGGTFSAFSSESDATPPEVLQVSVDKVAVAPGEKNTIEVEARDGQSGLASVTGACQSPSKSALIWFYGILNADSGAWVGDVQLPRNADCGTWTIQQLAVKDTAGNTTLLQADSPLLAHATFQVTSGSDCDFTPPTLEAFDLTPSIVPSGTAAEIVVTARVYDVGSGAATMTGWFEGPTPASGQVPKIYFVCAPATGDPDAPWTGRIQVPQLAATGTWKVGSIRIEDKAKNFRTYTSGDPAVAGRVFQVQ